MQLEKRKGMKIVWFENYSHYRCSEPSESGLVCISNQANQWGNWAPGATCARTLWQFKLGWLANVYKWGKTVWKEIVVMENVLLQGIPRNAGHLIPTQPARSVQDNFKKKTCLCIVLSVLMLQFSPVNNSSPFCSVWLFNPTYRIAMFKAIVASLMPFLTYFRPILPGCISTHILFHVRPTQERTNDESRHPEVATCGN